MLMSNPMLQQHYHCRNGRRPDRNRPPRTHSVGQKEAVREETLRHALEREVDSDHGLRDRSGRPDHLIQVLACSRGVAILFQL